jgi:hypothetical protein
VDEREVFTEEPEIDCINESSNEISDISEDNFYDPDSDVSVDELLAANVQFTATNDLDPDSVFCYQTANAFDAPFAYKQAISCAEVGMWKASIQEELESIYENDVWELVPKPKDCKPIGCRYVFKTSAQEIACFIRCHVLADVKKHNNIVEDNYGYI